MSFRAEREILALNEVKNLRSLTRVRDNKWFTSYYLFSRFALSGRRCASDCFAITKRGVIAMTGENLWKVTGNYQIKSIIRDEH